MIDEGYIKYSADRRDGKIPLPKWMHDMNMVRTTLWNMRLLGVYPNGIGYGNISHRHEGNSFIISGSATGEKMILQPDEYALVESFDLANNSIKAVGKIDASSESMSHGAIYEALPETNVVMHFHSRKIFDSMIKGDYPTTSKEMAFGTPELAMAISKLVLEKGTPNGILVTAGHDEGVIAYGTDLDSAYDEMDAVYKLYK